jgi:hypothetical protein
VRALSCVAQATCACGQDRLGGEAGNRRGQQQENDAARHAVRTWLHLDGATAGVGGSGVPMEGGEGYRQPHL